MAITIKSRQEIAQLREAGRLVAETYEVLRPHVVPGATTAQLDRIAEEYIRKHGATPMYKGYGARPASNGRPATPPFPATICVAINDVICHGIPSPKQTLRSGDIVGIDIGVLFNGWVGDACQTFAVGTVDAKSQKLVDTARRCLELGIAEARPNHHLGDIGAAIQTYAEGQGFSVVRDLVGHGVGHALWEEPQVAHFGKPGTGLKIRPGMVFTIEPMINIGKPGIRTLADRWTISTADGSRSAQFEHTLAITDGEPEILTLL
jgi:methionyl aminopeptidase